MRNITAVVYQSGKLQLILHGSEDQVNNNLAMHDFHEDADRHTRILVGDIANAVDLFDPRLPQTVEEFDARYSSSAP